MHMHFPFAVQAASSGAVPSLAETSSRACACTCTCTCSRRASLPTFGPTPTGRGASFKLASPGKWDRSFYFRGKKSNCCYSLELNKLLYFLQLILASLFSAHCSRRGHSWANPNTMQWHSSRWTASRRSTYTHMNKLLYTLSRLLLPTNPLLYYFCRLPRWRIFAVEGKVHCQATLSLKST